MVEPIIRSKNYYADSGEAWNATKLEWPNFSKKKKPDLDKMKAEYIAKYGYVVVIPDFDDVVHYKPDAWMTEKERITRKARNLQKIIASPVPAWANAYASAMTWLDNIQDAMTTGLMLSIGLRKVLPKVFARLVPYLGWGLLAHDLLSALVALGRSPFTPMKGKRKLCALIEKNPRKKKRKYGRAERLWRMKPSWGAASEVLQTTDWLFGVGLSLGAIYGYLTDFAFSGYRMVTGEKVRIVKDPPLHELYDVTGFKSIQAAAMIQSAGQVFDEETHFWTHITHVGNTILTAPIIHDDPPEDYYEDPMQVVIPAPEPTNPETRKVIEDAGLKIADGVRWPANEDKEISLDELSDWQAVHALDNTTDYLERHKKDWNGFLVSTLVSQANEHLLEAVDPGAEVEEEYDAPTHITLQMMKYGITPTDETQTAEWDKFELWCRDYRDTKRSWPNIEETKQGLESAGVSYRTSFPETQDPRAAEIFPEDALNDELWEKEYETWGV